MKEKRESQYKIFLDLWEFTHFNLNSNFVRQIVWEMEKQLV